jgi:hypothetical protein
MWNLCFSYALRFKGSFYTIQSVSVKPTGFFGPTAVVQKSIDS